MNVHSILCKFVLKANLHNILCTFICAVHFWPNASGGYMVHQLKCTRCNKSMRTRSSLSVCTFVFCRCSQSNIQSTSNGVYKRSIHSSSEAVHRLYRLILYSFGSSLRLLCIRNTGLNRTPLNVPPMCPEIPFANCIEKYNSSLYKTPSHPDASHQQSTRVNRIDAQQAATANPDKLVTIIITTARTHKHN